MDRKSARPFEAPYDLAQELNRLVEREVREGMAQEGHQIVALVPEFNLEHIGEGEFDGGALAFGFDPGEVEHERRVVDPGHPRAEALEEEAEWPRATAQIQHRITRLHHCGKVRPQLINEVGAGFD